MAKIQNPFRFGTVVTGDSFIDRREMIDYVRNFMASENHLVIIAPRRYGKTSLALRATSTMGRPVLNINLQNVIDEADFARQLIKATLRCYPLQRIKYAFKHFAVVPTISTDPVTGSIEVAISPTVKASTALDDALALLEHAGEREERPIVILDEFQEANNIAPNMLQRLRAIMQLQNHVNYILLGSQESMMREIFEKKRSPFYHFGTLLHLPPLPREELHDFIVRGLSLCHDGDTAQMATEILDFTLCHPYYTQELAFYAWNELKDNPTPGQEFIDRVIAHAVTRKDYDYERMWARMSPNCKKLIKALANSPGTALYTKQFIVNHGFNAASTVRGNIQRLLSDGYIVNDDTMRKPRVEDPFFARWLRQLP